MEASSIITIIVCVAIMGAAIWYYLKACKAYDKADMMRIEAEASDEGHLEARKYLESLIAVGTPLCYIIDEGDTFCDVCAQYNSFADRKTFDIIKRFPYADDKSYALREAEYLLQTLNEK